MDNGKGQGSSEIVSILLAKKKKLFIMVALLSSVFVCFIIIIGAATFDSELIQNYVSMSVVGGDTIYGDEKVVSLIEEKYDMHSYIVKDNFSVFQDKNFVPSAVVDKKEKIDYTEETAQDNVFFQELKRQAFIWVDDYNSFGIAHNPGSLFFVIDDFKTNTMDFTNIVVTANHRGLTNFYSHLYTFNDKYDDLIIDEDDGTKLNDYENESIVHNRDTRDFYEQAKDKLGSTFFWYPGTREMFGNSISAEVTWDPAKALYLTDSTGTSVISIVNIGLLMSDYHVLAKMSLQDENAYQAYIDPERFPRGPYTDLGYFIRALDDGYNKCFYEKDKTLQNWTWLNVCNDYKLFFEEVEYLGEYYTHITSADQLQQIINDAVPETHNLKHAIFPQYETQEDGRIAHNFRDDIKKVEEELAKNPKPNSVVPGFQYFIEVTVDRYYDEELYDKYLKELYIPYIYINCDNCAYKNANQNSKDFKVNQIYNDIENMEQAYRYYNGEGLMELGSNDSSGSSVIVGGKYQCGNMTINISGDYCDGPDKEKCRSHNAVDVSTNVKHPNVKPLLGGKVYSVHNSCPNSPVCPYADAMLFVTGGSISNVSPACLCGGKLGNHVVIESTYNGKTYYTVYAHLSAVNVSVGDEVTTDTIIGVMGTTGMSTGDHLHIEMHEGDRWNPKFSPEKFFSNSQIGSSICDDEGEDTDEKEV